MKERVTFAGTYNQVIKIGGEYTMHGYHIADTTDVIDWPFFWRRRYIIVMEKSIDNAENENYIAYVIARIWSDRRALNNAWVGFFPTIEEQLQIAVEQENYEEAARLRDIINNDRK